MSEEEEVTYATIKFAADAPRAAKESFSLQTRDPHEAPERKLVGEAENTPESVGRTAGVPGSRARGGRSAARGAWLPLSLVSLAVNLLVLAGVVGLVLKSYQEHIFSDRTCEMSQSSQVQWYGNLTLYRDMCGNVSREFVDIKEKLSTLMKISNCTSKSEVQKEQNGSDILMTTPDYSKSPPSNTSAK